MYTDNISMNTPRAPLQTAAQGVCGFVSTGNIASVYNQTLMSWILASIYGLWRKCVCVCFETNTYF